VAGGHVADREHTVFAGSTVVVDDDLSVVIQITAQLLGQVCIVVTPVHRESTAVLSGGAILEFVGLQPAVVAFLHASKFVMDNIDWMCLQLLGCLVAPFGFVTPGEEVNIFGEVQQDHRNVGCRLVGPHHEHRLVDEHVRITVETPVKPAPGPWQRRLRSTVREPSREEESVRAVLVVARAHDEFGVTTVVDPSRVGDVASVQVGSVFLNLLVCGPEELVARDIFCHANDVVRVHHHRGPTAASVEHGHILTESSCVQRRTEPRWAAADNRHVVAVCH
jgi:hypothetical protein